MSRAASLGELLDGLADVGGACAVAVNGVSMDSRRVRAGDLFLACAGARAHGATHARDAVARGAVAVAVEPVAEEAVTALPVPVVAVPRLRRRAGEVADRFYAHPSRDLAVVGITGTNGKTSVSLFIAAALGETAPCGVVGTLGAGLYGSLQDTGHTTPDPVTLHAALARMRDAGARWAAMEVSSHALDQGRVAGVRFACGVFTNLTHDHLDYHGTLEHYAAAKRRLFDLPGMGHAVINVDDPVGRSWLAHLPAPIEVIGYSLDGAARADLTGEELRLGPDGLSMTLNFRGRRAPLATPLLGRFNAYNLLAAAGALVALGLPLDQVARRLAHAPVVPGRMERFGGAGRPLVVVDYAHTPDALENVLKALREHCRGRLWCVFGCGGDRDPSKRPVMGQVAESRADHLVVTDDNPRGEEPQAIVAAILAGMVRPRQAAVIHERGAAIAHALAAAAPEDVVLVAGKGHETYQEYRDGRRDFSDCAAVAHLLAGNAHG